MQAKHWWAVAGGVAALAFGVILPTFSGPVISGSGSGFYFPVGITIPTAQTAKFNAGATTTVQDSSGDLRVDVATGKNIKVYVNGSQEIGLGAGGVTTTGTSLFARATEYGHVYFTQTAYGGAIGYDMRADPTDSGGNYAFRFRGGNAGLTNAGIATFTAGTAEKASVDKDGKGTFYAGVAFSSGGTAVTKHITGTATIDFASTGAGACAGWSATTATVTGAVLGDRCTVGSTADMSAVNGVVSCVVTSANTAKFNFCSGAAAQDPASQTYTAEVWH